MFCKGRPVRGVGHLEGGRLPEQGRVQLVDRHPPLALARAHCHLHPHAYGVGGVYKNVFNDRLVYVLI